MTYKVTNNKSSISDYLKWQNDIIKEGVEEWQISGFTISLVINLCALIESLMTSIISNQIGSTVNTNKFAERLINDFSSSLYKDSWATLLNKLEIVLDIKISDIVDQKDIKSIKILFQLRHQITHGNDIRSSNYYGNGIKTKAFKVIFNYLVEIGVFQIRNTKAIEILSLPVYYHFLKGTKSYFNQICNSLPPENRSYVKAQILCFLDRLPDN